MESIKFKKAQVEKASANSDGVDGWKLTKLLQQLTKFPLKNIYNSNETGLYYCAIPDGSMCFKHESIAKSKKAIDKITLLCCVNVSGADKKKVLVIEISKKSLLFSTNHFTKITR